MSVLRVFKELLRQTTKYRCFSSVSSEGEYTTLPQYPPILDLSYEKVKERKEEAEYEEIKAVKTVEEKQIKLNMPRYYGFKCHVLMENHIPYNNLEFTQHITRTHLIESSKLPEFYDKNDVNEHVNELRSVLEELILFELEGFRKINDLRQEELDKAQVENIISSNLSRQINRLLFTSCPQLVNTQVDVNPRIESSWFVGGMNPPERIKQSRMGQEWQKNKANEPVDRLLNYMGSPNLALRSNNPLLPIVSLKEAENVDLEVPFFQYDPRVVGIYTDYKHIANVPGFWPGDPNEFGILSYHPRGHFLTRSYNDDKDNKEALHRQGILASFAWLNSQANHLGFTSFNDITYPLVTQSIITNGKLWSFYVYQLNTIKFHGKYIKENLKRNICWATPEISLYEHIQDGKLVGFNDEVLKMLLKLYLNPPESRLGVNLKPYLSKEEKVCADYENDDKRQWLEREYKFLVSNRPRHKLPYEIYAWEKIYKIDNETRFMERRSRPFELKTNPWKRRLDDRKPQYIPRVLRPDLPKYKGRDAKEYFP